MTTFLYLTNPIYEPARVAEEERDVIWWSTHSEAKAGDTAIVYVNGVGISHVWTILEDAFKSPDWHYAAAVGHEFDLKSPITMHDLLEEFTLEEFPALKQRLRGLRAMKLADKIEQRLMKMCLARRLSPSVKRAAKARVKKKAANKVPKSPKSSKRKR